MQPAAAPTAPRCARSLALATVVLVALGVGGVATPSGAAAPPDHTEDRVEAAAWWTATELDRVADAAASGGVVDVGLTLDHALALLALGRERTVVDRTLTAIEPRVAGYVAGDPRHPVTGHLAKTLFTAVATGRSTTFGGVDLAGELRANMVTTGDRAGEFPRFRGDTRGEGFYQAWSVLALARAGGAPPASVEWLLRVQCPTGGFPSAYPVPLTGSCPRGGHIDATAMAIQALQVVPRTATTAAAIQRAADWLVSVQGPDGGLSDNDGRPTNTNSTGLAAQALRATGRTAAADRARAWVEARQLLCGASPADRGGFAYTDPAEGVDVRAHPQAVLALGLAPYGAIGGGGSAPARPLWCSSDGGGGEGGGGDDGGRGDDGGDDGGGGNPDGDGSPPPPGPTDPPEPSAPPERPEVGPDRPVPPGGDDDATGIAADGDDEDAPGRGQTPDDTDTDAQEGDDEAPAEADGDDERAAVASRPTTVHGASRPRSLLPVTAGAATLAVAAIVGLRSGAVGRKRRSGAGGGLPATATGATATATTTATATATGGAPEARGTTGPPSGPPAPDDTDDLPTYG